MRTYPLSTIQCRPCTARSETGASVGRQKVKSDRGYNPGLPQYMQGALLLSFLAALLGLQQPRVVLPDLPHPLPTQ